jgi:hypothetical protein
MGRRGGVSSWISTARCGNAPGSCDSTLLESGRLLCLRGLDHQHGSSSRSRLRRLARRRGRSTHPKYRSKSGTACPARPDPRREECGGSPTAAALFEFVARVLRIGQHVAELRERPKLNFPTWKTMLGSSSSGSLKKRTMQPGREGLRGRVVPDRGAAGSPHLLGDLRAAEDDRADVRRLQRVRRTTSRSRPTGC